MDLYCWMLLASRSLVSIAATLGVPKQVLLGTPVSYSVLLHAAS